MNKYILALFFLFILSCSYSQFYEDFSDKELLNNPTWNGNVDSFTVNNALQLQLNATVAGTAYLSSMAKTVHGKTEWRFWIKLAFAGSNNNYAKFYIASNTENLIDTALEGYYLRFGENGNADAIRFYKQSGNQHQLLMSGKDSAIANSFSIFVKIIYSDSGYWQLFTANEDEKVFLLENECQDSMHFEMTHLGIVCTYTKSNSTKFYFDDIYCDEIYIDKEPPYIDSLYIDEEKQTISLYFNESLDSISALNRLNYTIFPNNRHPDTIVAFNSNYSALLLCFHSAFEYNKLCTLHIANVLDLSDNPMNDTAFTFFLYRSSIFDVVINEIMAKPAPQQELPEVEYIELINRSPYVINIEGWKLYFGKNIRTVEKAVLSPLEHIIVTAKSNVSAMSVYGKTVAVSSMSITDGGQLIRLYDNKDNFIHSVEFTPEWHNKSKKDGGWSLEMIDYDNPCNEANNWTSSVDSKGGTPGQKNSVYTLNPDNIAPRIKRISTPDSLHLIVYFSEKMLGENICNPRAYQIDRKIKIDSISVLSEEMKAVLIHLNNSLNSGIIYRLSICDTIIDCAGNMIPLQSSLFFGYTQTIDSFDIVINEVLFNPKDDGVDFVEIYNRSDKILDLKNLRLSTLKKGEIDTGKIIIEEGFQFFPKNYALLSTNPSVVQLQYHYQNEDNFIKMNSFPIYANEKGVVILLSDNKVIDRFDYVESMHYPLLKSVDGVSLERIHPDRKTQDASNWHSAASTVGYATPCYLNSCYSESKVSVSKFATYPEIFSPDQDGYNDLLHITYKMEQAGYKATITIYDVGGRKVKTLANNILLDTDGVITWDGTTDENLKAAVGTYIIVIDYFNLKGKVKREKLTTTLAIKH